MRGPRYAEEMFPMKEISEISAKEKNIRHGHISTFHLWWARRPLASSRAMNFAALIPYPKNFEEVKKKKDFIVKLSKWENSLEQTILKRATEDILDSNGGKQPKVLDPFAGGGSIPLEALRLGCEVYASDYNPVACLILKCILEYPQTYAMKNKTKDKTSELDLIPEKTNELLDDVKKWGTWVFEQSKKEIRQYYLENKEISVGYIWARTIHCQDPTCNAEIPLMRQYWLVRTKRKRISLYPFIRNKIIKVKVVGDGYEDIPPGFDPARGTISKGIATCLVCGSSVDNKSIARVFSDGKSDERMMAVVTHKEGASGKRYRIANEDDVKIFKKATEYFETKRKKLLEDSGIDPVPDELIPTPDNREYERGNLLYNFTPILLYGMTKWRDLFNSGQKLALITFVEKVRNAYSEMIRQGYDREHAKVVTTYLAIIVDRLADKNAKLVVYDSTRETIEHVFGRQALGMVWDYTELNPFTSVGWLNMQKWVEEVLEHCFQIGLFTRSNFVPVIKQFTATSIPYGDNYFDAVFTDPPYYDNIPYAVLSDFFYVWLKRTIGDLYPELFSTPLTPKSQEVIADLPLLRGMKKEDAISIVPNIKTSKHFEDLLLQSFKEIYRVLKSNGISIIIYAHKSTAGWETLINSLLDSGLVVTAAWPISTEMKERLRATESAALASSIYMVAGKYEKTKLGFYRDVRKDLKEHLTIELDKLWNEGISGADFLVAAIGSAIEVFGIYQKIIDDEGNEIRANKLLEQVRQIVTDYAVRQVLHNGFASEISQMTRFYLLWRWAYGEAKIQFDDARKLAQSVGIDLTDTWNKGFIQKDKEFIRILGPLDRNAEELRDSNELMDILHRVLLLWNNGKSAEVLDVLQQSGHGKSDTFYRIAQAISESLPNESKEKKWLEGFLAGKARISKQIKIESGQRRLFQ